MLTSTPCPEPNAYRQLTCGQLPVEQAESLLQHLETCDVCVAKIRTLPASDTLIEWIRQGKSSPSSEEKPLTPLMQRLIQLGKSGASMTGGPAGMLTFSCPGCRKPLRVKEASAGKKVKCPHCGLVATAPKAGGTGVSPVISAGGSGVSPVGGSGVSPVGGTGVSPVVSAGGTGVSPVGGTGVSPVGGTGVSPVGGTGVSPVSSAGMQTVDLVSAPSETSKVDTSSGTPTLATPRQSDKERQLCSFLAPPQKPDELGRLGAYRVLKVLGAGGMGVVFRAEDPQLQRIVALKAMLPALAENDAARQRFLREARLAASLKHDHIVTIFQVGEDRGAPFLAMEFLEGEALEDRLKREGKLPLAEVLRIGREIAEGLQAAHEHGLIHRDIKPANVWLEGKRGRAKILDFGLARSSADDVHLTQSGAIVGTPAYMPPEQARGDKVDGRCDLYSLGCVLYRLCTGELPFKGDNTMSLLLALATEQAKSPREINADVPQPLADLILRLLAKDPAQRPATAGDVAEAIQDIAVEKSPAPAAPRTPPPPRRRRRLLVAAASGAFALAVMLTVIVIRLGKPEDGTVTIETVDPNVQLVFLSGGREVTVRDGKDGAEFKLPLGSYQVALKDGKNGFQLEPIQFTLKRGERVLVKVKRQTGAQPEEARAKKQPGQVIDLIEVFQDADRIAVKGLTEKNQWSKSAGKLTYTSDGHSGKILVPVSLNDVRDYEIDAQVRRLSGNSVFTFDLLTTPTRQTGLDIYIRGRIELKLEGGRRSQIGAWPASVGNAGHIVTRVHFDADGRHGSVTVTVEGQLAAKWKGDLSAIGTPIEFHPAFPGEQVPGMFCFQDSFEFSSWQLRVYEGRAQLLSRRAPVSPVRIPESPPLAEWLKGRKVLTVSQDGKGQFKTIKAALDALKPHQVVKVLDHGPYRESLQVGGLPADTGLISERQAVLEIPRPDESHHFGPLDGFRLSGFRLLAPPPNTRWNWMSHWHRPSGLVIEDCCFAWTKPSEESAVCLLFEKNERDCKPVVVRNCLFDSANFAFEAPGGSVPTVVVLGNYFKNAWLASTSARYQKVLIRHNVFEPPTDRLGVWVEKLKEVSQILEISNNTFVSKSGSISIVESAPKGGILIRNNCSDHAIGLGPKALADVGDSIKNWQLDHNCYIRGGSLPKASSDVVEEPPFLSLDPSHPDYLRIAADGPAAKGGAGGAWPSYIGALPPGPAPKDGDWFTRLRQRWGNVAPAAKPLSPPTKIPEPPPLTEWLKGRKILTVSQDGKGQYKTIQAALAALKPRQVVKVLDRGPYRERLDLADLPDDSGLISEQGTVLELSEWRPPLKEVAPFFQGHHLAVAHGFRLNGFVLAFPKKTDGFGLSIVDVDGFVLENCLIRSSASNKWGVSLRIGWFKEMKARPVWVRECAFEGTLAVNSYNRFAEVLIERNYFLGEGIAYHVSFAAERYARAVIRGNVFSGRPLDFELIFQAVKEVKELEISNNTTLSAAPLGFTNTTLDGSVRIRNNLRTRAGLIAMAVDAEKGMPQAVRSWQVGNNSYPRQLVEPDRGLQAKNVFPKAETDVLAAPRFLSDDSAAADYLRIPADSPLAKAGAGGAWPSYIGALPPGPAPKDGDWFTRLRQRWGNLTKSETLLPSNPPLDPAWIKQVAALPAEK
ncbi:MAG TPA: protein kinase, partial [Gemmataceae bacterium]|nr:protein kinase [Gemmataceae bacterium]